MTDSIPQWAQAAVAARRRRLDEIERQLYRELTPDQWSMVAEIIDGYPVESDPWRDYYDRVTETVARHFGEMGVAIRAIYEHVMLTDIGQPSEVGQPGRCGLGPHHSEPFVL